MGKHKVYLITNKVNDTKYIGKTSGSLQERFKQHKRRSKSDKMKSYRLHHSMKKHGFDNFQIELLEEFETENEAYEAEVKYIAKYDTYHGDGYNLTLGGTGAGHGEHNPKSKLLNEDVSHIKWILSNVDTTNKQVAKYYGVSANSILKIQKHVTWVNVEEKNPDFDIPDSLIRQKLIGENANNVKITRKQASEIKWLVKNTDMTHSQITSHYSVSTHILRDIKRGNSWVHVEGRRPKHLTGYQMKRDSKNKTISDQDASEIKWLALENDMTQQEIANMYGVSRKTIYNLKYERKRSDVKPAKPSFVKIL